MSIDEFEQRFGIVPTMCATIHGTGEVFFKASNGQIYDESGRRLPLTERPEIWSVLASDVTIIGRIDDPDFASRLAAVQEQARVRKVH